MMKFLLVTVALLAVASGINAQEEISALQVDSSATARVTEPLHSIMSLVRSADKAFAKLNHLDRPWSHTTYGRHHIPYVQRRHSHRWTRHPRAPHVHHVYHELYHNYNSTNHVIQPFQEHVQPFYTSDADTTKAPIPPQLVQSPPNPTNQEPIHWIHDSPAEFDPSNALTPTEMKQVEKFKRKIKWILHHLNSPLSEEQDYSEVRDVRLLHAFDKLKRDVKTMLDEYELRTGVRTIAYKLQQQPEGLTDAVGYILTTPTYWKTPNFNKPWPKSNVAITVQDGEKGLNAQIDLQEPAKPTVEEKSKPYITIGHPDSPADIHLTINPPTLDGSIVANAKKNSTSAASVRFQQLKKRIQENQQ